MILKRSGNFTAGAARINDIPKITQNAADNGIPKSDLKKSLIALTNASDIAIESTKGMTMAAYPKTMNTEILASIFSSKDNPEICVWIHSHSFVAHLLDLFVMKLLL
jgi:hypothetical protein